MKDPITLPRELAMRLAAYTGHGDECSIADPVSRACSCGLSATLQEWRTAMTGGTESAAEPYSIRQSLASAPQPVEDGVEVCPECHGAGCDMCSNGFIPTFPQANAKASAPQVSGGKTPGQLLYELRGHFFNGGGWADYPEWSDYGPEGHAEWESLAKAIGSDVKAAALAALSQEAEPVAWRSDVLDTIGGFSSWVLTREPYTPTKGERVRTVQPLYTHPSDRGGEVKG